MTRTLWLASFLLMTVCLTPIARSEEPEGALAPRLMFVSLRVTDLEKSLDFYTRILGMREFARYPSEHSLEEVALTFATEISGAEPTDSGAMLVLVPRPPGAGPLEHGNGLSRVALGVPDVTGVVASTAEAGYDVLRPPASISDGNRVVAFVVDPDGYRIELIGPAAPGS